MMQACYQALQISASHLRFNLLFEPCKETLVYTYVCPLGLPAGHEAVAHSTHGTECLCFAARAWLKA